MGQAEYLPNFCFFSDCLIITPQLPPNYPPITPQLSLNYLSLSPIINSKCEEIGGGITFICVLNGGFMFFSDLVKQIKYPIKLDFVQCKSYNDMQQQELQIPRHSTADLVEEDKREKR